MKPFPYKRNESDPQMTRAEFDALSDEDAFAICFPGVINGSVNGYQQSSHSFDITQMPY